nr:hypothetical protein [Burkholderia ambifaria]
MRKYSSLILLLISLGDVSAEVVSSCDGRYLATDVVRGRMAIEKDGKNFGSAKVGHAIHGGVFSLDNSMLVVFGLPNKIDVSYPQVMHLSVFSLGSKIEIIESQVYGGAVYDAAFSVDKKYIVVSNQFGVDVIDVVEKRSSSFDIAYLPKFDVQQCHAR